MCFESLSHRGLILHVQWVVPSVDRKRFFDENDIDKPARAIVAILIERSLASIKTFKSSTNTRCRLGQKQNGWPRTKTLATYHRSFGSEYFQKALRLHVTTGDFGRDFCQGCEAETVIQYKSIPAQADLYWLPKIWYVENLLKNTLLDFVFFQV
jgi:hypothetical protein